VPKPSVQKLLNPEIIMKMSRILAALSRRAPAAENTEPDEAQISGASFVQQEPDPVKEVGLTAREISGWAMGGSGALD